MAILLGPDLVPKSSGNVIRIRNVLDGAVDDVGLGHFHQVADTASDEALEDEDVTLDIQTGVVRELRLSFQGSYPRPTCWEVEPFKSIQPISGPLSSSISAEAQQA